MTAEDNRYIVLCYDEYEPFWGILSVLAEAEEYAKDRIAICDKVEIYQLGDLVYQIR